MMMTFAVHRVVRSDPSGPGTGQPLGGIRPDPDESGCNTDDTDITLTRTTLDVQVAKMNAIRSPSCIQTGSSTWTCVGMPGRMTTLIGLDAVAAAALGDHLFGPQGDVTWPLPRGEGGTAAVADSDDQVAVWRRHQSVRSIPGPDRTMLRTLDEVPAVLWQACPCVGDRQAFA
jgi:hypothetical protein